MSEHRLDLSACARRYFRIAGREIPDEEKRSINAAIKFAHAALLEYQRLEEKSIEVAAAERAARSLPISALDLVAVVELNRSLRRRTTIAGDLWQGLSYLLERDLLVCDWQLLLAELEELALTR